MYKDPFEQIRRQHQQIQQAFKSPIEQVLKHHQQIQQAFESPFDNVIKQRQQIQQAIESPIQQLLNHHQQIQQTFESPIEHLIKHQRQIDNILRNNSLFRFSPTYQNINLQQINESLSVILNPEILERIDFETPTNEDILGINDGEIINNESSDLSNSITNLENRIVQHLSSNKKITIGVILLFIYEEYAREIALLIMKMFFTLIISAYSEQSSTELMTTLQNQITETSTFREINSLYKEAKPDFLDYKFGIIRAEIILRQASSQKSPVVNNGKFPRNTVVKIIQRKNNWINVQIEENDTCINGWVQESKVIKLKEVKK